MITTHSVFNLWAALSCLARNVHTTLKGVNNAKKFPVMRGVECLWSGDEIPVRVMNVMKSASKQMDSVKSTCWLSLWTRARQPACTAGSTCPRKSAHWDQECIWSPYQHSTHTVSGCDSLHGVSVLSAATLQSVHGKVFVCFLLCMLLTFPQHKHDYKNITCDEKPDWMLDQRKKLGFQI